MPKPKSGAVTRPNPFPTLMTEDRPRVSLPVVVLGAGDEMLRRAFAARQHAAVAA
jgi:hypothetical protein